MFSHTKHLHLVNSRALITNLKIKKLDVFILKYLRKTLNGFCLFVEGFVETGYIIKVAASKSSLKISYEEYLSRYSSIELPLRLGLMAH